jgi:2-polyprenyl-3-methyl-5-hydroxy-6-metoxy-1,4-benzoquinol methylase
MTKGSLALVQCGACGMGYADPLPPESSPAYYDALGQPYYLSPDKLAGDYSPVRFSRELALTRRFAPKGALLDVGCGTGGFLFQLQTRHENDYAVTGLEVSAPAAEHARAQGLHVIQAPLTEHRFGDARFDSVTFWAVLEHLPDPLAQTRRASELLRPGGVLLALVPNRRSLAMRLLGPWYRYVLPEHVNYFSTQTLAELVTRAGLNVVATGGAHFNPIVIWQDWRRGALATVPESQRAALLRRTTRMKQSPLLAPARLAIAAIEKALATAGLADNIWIAARKPA